MIIRFNASALRQTLGGAMTVIAGLIAARSGPVIGGLFLAFPAIFPASATSSPAWALLLAAASWLGVAILAWQMRRHDWRRS
jgi:hypothetical protein